MCVNLFQPLDFVLHFDLSGPGVVLRQPLALSWMLHLQLKTLQILQLAAEIIDQLWGRAQVRCNCQIFSRNASVICLFLKQAYFGVLQGVREV